MTQGFLLNVHLGSRIERVQGGPIAGTHLGLAEVVLFVYFHNFIRKNQFVTREFAFLQQKESHHACAEIRNTCDVISTTVFEKLIQFGTRGEVTKKRGAGGRMFWNASQCFSSGLKTFFLPKQKKREQIYTQMKFASRRCNTREESIGIITKFIYAIVSEQFWTNEILLQKKKDFLFIFFFLQKCLTIFLTDNLIV